MSRLTVVVESGDDIGRWMGGRCRGCGETLRIGLPAELEVIAVATKAFCRIHERHCWAPDPPWDELSELIRVGTFVRNVRHAHAFRVGETVGIMRIGQDIGIAYRDRQDIVRLIRIPVREATRMIWPGEIVRNASPALAQSGKLTWLTRLWAALMDRATREEFYAGGPLRLNTPKPAETPPWPHASGKEED